MRCGCQEGSTPIKDVLDENVVTMILKFDTTTGKVLVGGPMDNKVLCYG
ncbi:hypothetical protein LCGC14_1884360, partial [marine sediment metagenome]